MTVKGKGGSSSTMSVVDKVDRNLSLQSLMVESETSVLPTQV